MSSHTLGSGTQPSWPQTVGTLHHPMCRIIQYCYNIITEDTYKLMLVTWRWTKVPRILNWVSSALRSFTFALFLTYTIFPSLYHVNVLEVKYLHEHSEDYHCQTPETQQDKWPGTRRTLLYSEQWNKFVTHLPIINFFQSNNLKKSSHKSQTFVCLPSNN